jgi:hypothetical protein
MPHSRQNSVRRRVTSGRIRVHRRVMTKGNANTMMKKVTMNAVKRSVMLNRMVGKKREI